MSYNTALTSDQLEMLRGAADVDQTHSAALYLSVCPNTVIYTARVNQASFGTSFAQFEYDGGSGTLADVRVGMNFFVSHSNDIAASFFTGRIRKTSGMTTFYCNETSAAFADNDYVFIVEDFRIWDKLSTYNKATKIQSPDYDVTFRELRAIITNLKAGYVVMTDGDDGEFSFAPNVEAGKLGANIIDYLWEVGDGTITVGADTDKDITVTFPPGHRYIHFTVTDSENVISERHIPIWVHDPDHMPTPLDIGDLEVSAAIDDGYSGSITAFAGVEDILDNTLVVAWLDAERYNGDLATMVDNIALLGRLRSGHDSTSYDDSGQQNAELRYEIEGPLQTLARLEITSLEILSDSTPTKFCQVSGCTPWREIFLILTEFSTFHELHSVAFDDTSTAFADLGTTTPAGSILNAISRIAECINARVQANAAGEIEIVRDAVMLDADERDALVVVADWDVSDIVGQIDRDHSAVRIVGRVLGSGGSYNTTSRKSIPVNSVAPGQAQDYPEGGSSLDNQQLSSNLTKVAANAELNIRTGHALARAQGTDELVLTHFDGYWWLTPSANQWYTFTFDGSELVSGLVLDDTIRWQLVSITATHQLETGTREVQATYRRETSGDPGQTIVYPPQSSAPLTLPEFPPVTAWPSIDLPDFFLPDDLTSDLVPASLAGTLISNPKHDGSVLFVGTPNQAFICPDALTQLTPGWIDVTPELLPGEIITYGKIIQKPTPGAYLLTSGVEWTHTFDFTEGDEGWEIWHDPICDCDVGIYSGGFESAYRDNGVSDQTRVVITYSGTTPSVLTSASLEFSWTKGVDVPGTPPQRTMLMGTFINGNDVFSFFPENGVQTYNWTGSVPFTDLALDGMAGLRFPQDHSSPLGRCVITKLTVGGSGANPFTGDPPAPATGRLFYKANLLDSETPWVAYEIPIAASNVLRTGETWDDVYLYDPSNAEAYYSDDKGETWSSAISVGTPPDEAGGFDTQKIGTVSLGAADEKVRRAATQGGSYSDYTIYLPDAIPTAIFIPRYKIGDGSDNGASEDEPDYFTASSASDTAAGHSVWKVTTGGGSVTQIDPLSGGHHGLAIGPNCLHIPWFRTAYQDLMGILLFGSDRKLAVSLDAGSTWEITGTLDASASMLVTRRSDTSRKQLWITNGANLGYCSDYKSSPLILAARIGPSSSSIIFVDVLA